MKPMRNVANKIFGAVASAALVATPVAMANAEDAVTSANTNVAVATVDPLQVQYVGAQDQTLNDARTLVADASHNKVAIVVWGGNRTLQQEAYNAALDLVDMGIPTAFVLAPDHNSSEAEAVMQVYAGSRPYTDAAIGTDHANIVRTTMREAGVVAYRDAFPQRVAALSLR
tara:strand:- start:5381 stop:5893 length:513 start_codon:yes stop_codon:yes gene_type:complete